MEPLEISEGYFIDLESPYYQMILNGKTNLQIDVPGTTFPNFDPKREYRKNNYGYRSEDFSSNADILISGCSNTFGSGLDEDLRWGNVLAKKLNLIPQTIAQAGMSISWSVEKIMAHISIFGPPQRIVCLFPDPFRFLLVVDSKTISSYELEQSPYNGFEESVAYRRGQVVLHTDSSDTTDKKIKYLKKPFNAKAVISRDMALHASIRSIRVLEKYCNDVGIPFTWGTWDYNFSVIVESISTTNYKFENFINISDRKCNHYRKTTDQPKDVLFESRDDKLLDCVSNHRNDECSCYLKCHEEYRELVGSDQFYLGSDTLCGVEQAHFGAHVHMHFAEAFLSSLLEE
jgi:hypothetical protein